MVAATHARGKEEHGSSSWRNNLHDQSQDASRSSSRATGRTLAPSLGHDKWSARQSLYFTSSRLRLVKNPVERDARKDKDVENISEDGKGHALQRRRTEKNANSNAQKKLEQDEGAEEEPLRFQRREAASMLELFYDLWFVANLNVFTTVHPISEVATLASFIEYFLLLWVTWFVTTVFDARYGHDGIFERIAHAFHLAVMVGFAIVGVSFSESKLIEPIFKITSIFLFISRFVLAVQYGMVLFHARHHRRSRYTLTVAIALHLVPAIAYLSVAFVGSLSPARELFWIWFGLGLVEMGAIILHSTFSRTLSFEGTHFNERLNLLTLIIIGEGIIILTKNISKIVEYTFIKLPADDWSPALIGVIICSAATLYITFQLYFDWMHSHNIMKATQQAYWAIVHLPFHIALVLLAEGSSQWDVWWRAMESFRLTRTQLQSSVEERIDTLNTTYIVDGLRDKTYEILDKYGADVDEGGSMVQSLSKGFDLLRNLPDQFWGPGLKNESDPYFHDYAEGSRSVLTSTVLAISDAFDISVEMKQPKGGDGSWGGPEIEAVDKTAERLVLVLTYLFVSAGMVLILLMLMHLLSKRRGWSLFNMLRTATVCLLGIGLCLVPLILTNGEHAARYLHTPWQVPLIALSYLLVLILTHLPHPPRIFIKKTEADGHSDNMMPTPATASSMDRAQPQDTRRLNRLSHVAVKQSVALRRGMLNMKNIRVEMPQSDPVAERASPEERSSRRVGDGQTYFDDLSTPPYTARRFGFVYRPF